MNRTVLAALLLGSSSYLMAQDNVIMTTPINPSTPSTTAPSATFPGTSPHSNQPVDPANPALPRSLPNVPISIHTPVNEVNPPHMQNQGPALPEANVPTNPNVFSPSHPGIGVSPLPQEGVSPGASTTPNEGINIIPPVPIEPVQN